MKICNLFIFLFIPFLTYSQPISPTDSLIEGIGFLLDDKFNELDPYYFNILSVFVLQ